LRFSQYRSSPDDEETAMRDSSIGKTWPKNADWPAATGLQPRRPCQRTSSRIAASPGWWRVAIPTTTARC
jgi:hypothetical protein